MDDETFQCTTIMPYYLPITEKNNIQSVSKCVLNVVTSSGSIEKKSNSSDLSLFCNKGR